MTAQSTSEATQLTEDLSEDKPLLLLAAGLLIALAIMPFLPESVGADTAVRFFVLFLLFMAVMDIATLKVPNVLVYPSIAFALASTALIDLDAVVSALAGGGIVLVIMTVLAIVQRGAMGMGDVKIACFGGCILGVKGGVFSLLFGFVGAGVIALPVLLLRLRDRRDVMPLAPFIAIGILIAAWFWGFLIGGEVGFLI